MNQIMRNILKNLSRIIRFGLEALLIALFLLSTPAIAAKFDMPKENGQYSNIFKNNIEYLFPASKGFKKENKGNRRYNEIIFLIKSKKIKSAEEKINAFLIKSPNDSELYSIKGLIEETKNNKKLAFQNYQKAIELDEYNLTAHLALAKYYLHENNVIEAKTYITKVLEINDKYVNAYFLLADIENKKNNPKEIERILLTVFRKVEGDIQQETRVAKKLSNLYATQNTPIKLLNVAKDIYKRHPQNTLALSFLASANVVNNKRKIAVTLLKEAIKHDANNVKLRLILANLLSSMPGEEVEALNQITTIISDDINILVRQTTLLIKLKQYNKALELANKLSKLEPSSGIGKILEGDIYLSKMELGKAGLLYRQAYQLKQNKSTLNIIFRIMMSERKYDDAIDFLHKELKQNDKRLDIHFKLATAYTSKMDASNAEKHYLTILKYEPSSQTALNNLAWLYFQQNNPNALSFAEKAYKIEPNNYSILDTYGYILVKKGRFKEGIAALEHAVKLESRDLNVRYHLAMAYAMIKKKESALDILNLIVKSNKEFTEKKAAINLLKQLQSN